MFVLAIASKTTHADLIAQEIDTICPGVLLLGTLSDRSEIHLSHVELCGQEENFRMGMAVVLLWSKCYQRLPTDGAKNTKSVGISRATELREKDTKIETQRQRQIQR